MDLVALAEDEGGHLRVPEAGLMSEMDSRLQHLSHGHAGHEKLLFGLSLRASLAAILDALRQSKDTQPRRCRCACGVALPKKAALYTMKTSSEQCLTRSSWYKADMHV